MRTYLVTLLCVIIGMSASSGFAKNGVWVTADGASETAEALADGLAEQVVPKLKAGKMDVIFLDAQGCDVTEKVSKSSGSKEADLKENIETGKVWCQIFGDALESGLLSRGIKFLPASLRGDIRKEISNESLYQYGSMNIDETKAVALGKQKAFQAFVSVIVRRVDSKVYKASISVLSIREAAIVAKENTELQTIIIVPSPAKYIAGVMGIVGLGLGTYYQIPADQHNQAARDHEKTAEQNKSVAKEELQLADKEKETASAYRSKAAAGWILAGCGAVYAIMSLEHRYRIAISGPKDKSADKESASIAGSWSLALVPMEGTMGLGLGLDF